MSGRTYNKLTKWFHCEGQGGGGVIVADTTQIHRWVGFGDNGDCVVAPMTKWSGCEELGDKSI